MKASELEEGGQEDWQRMQVSLKVAWVDLKIIKLK
jgi:hypothetical protein